ncbi:MAG: ABC transporter substrate-binding protein [Myxococcaceae bacterium]
MHLRRSGWLFLLALLLLAVGYVVASRLGYLDRLQDRVIAKVVRGSVRLSSGDFPAGVSAPVGDIAAVPLRPTVIGFTPRGSSASLLLAAGGASQANADVPGPVFPGLFKSAYAIQVRAVVFSREEDLKKALAAGAENGGVDFAVLSVDRLAAWGSVLRDAAPRTLLLMGRSRGQEALASAAAKTLFELRGKKLGVYPQASTHYFALWALSRAGLSTGDVSFVELASSLEAGSALREGRVDAVVGLRGDVEPAAHDRGGRVLSSTADAPHLLASVLVSRGDYAARYPDAVRRILRGLLEAGAIVVKEPADGARLLGEIAPYLGDPVDAIQSAPPATLRDNLAFFGLSGEAPVTYDELFQSAAVLYGKVTQSTPGAHAEDTRDLTALKYVAEARSP